MALSVSPDLVRETETWITTAGTALKATAMSGGGMGVVIITTHMPQIPVTTTAAFKPSHRPPTRGHGLCADPSYQPTAYTFDVRYEWPSR